MKLFIIPVRVTDLPLYLSEKLLQQTSCIKVRTKDQKIFEFDASECRVQINKAANHVLNFVIALTGYGAKDIDRFFFLNEKNQMLYVSRPGHALRHELEKIWVGEKL